MFSLVNSQECMNVSSKPSQIFISVCLKVKWTVKVNTLLTELIHSLVQSGAQVSCYVAGFVADQAVAVENFSIC